MLESVAPSFPDYIQKIPHCLIQRIAIQSVHCGSLHQRAEIDRQLIDVKKVLNIESLVLILLKLVLSQQDKSYEHLLAHSRLEFRL